MSRSRCGRDDEEDVFKYAARFELEAQAMASLDHPAIVSVYDFGETEKGKLYFVMELIDGMDIHQYIRENGGILPQEHALSITAHVLDALEYAHKSGIMGMVSGLYSTAEKERVLRGASWLSGNLSPDPRKVIEGYLDGFDRTTPVGSF